MRLRRSIALLPLFLLASASVVQAGEPARIALTRDLDPAGTVRLVARVTDAAGAAVPGAAVTFVSRTAFGSLALGEAETGADGTAMLVLPPGQQVTEVVARAGEGQDLRAALVLKPGGRPVPAIRPSRDVLRSFSPQPGFISPYPVPQLVILGVILGGIWITYGYLVLLLARIRRA